MIEINPLYNGYKFKLNFIYEIPKIQKDQLKNLSVDEMISIDLGMINLATIYNPSGNQYIIKGNQLISKNEYFNKKISRLQLIAKKVNNTNSTKQIYNLLIKRKNQIDAIFDKIVNMWIGQGELHYLYTFLYWNMKIMNLPISSPSPPAEIYEESFDEIVNELEIEYGKYIPDMIADIKEYISKL